jgi:hypothetical protein
MTNPSLRLVLFATALLAAAALALLAAPGAAAGTYTAIQCHGPLGAGRADAEFRRTARSYAAATDCDGKGLSITHEAGRERTASGRFGEWTLTAPAGTEIVRASARVKAAGDDWHVPDLFVAFTGGGIRTLGRLDQERHKVRWSGAGGRKLAARLTCTHRHSCGAGPAAGIHLRRVALALRDASAPELKPAGALLAGGARRGPQELAAAATDDGAGVRAVTVEVNDEPVSARVFDCALAGAFAIRLRPCPAAPIARFNLGTSTPTFQQGPNALRVCAADYAPRARSNRTCKARTVRVDNLCPVSPVPGAVLRGRFRGAGSRLRVRSDEDAQVRGVLRTAAGAPVRGATVCVAARTRLDGAPERVLATPVTDATGSFSARIPAGPSRTVRIAHWPDRQRAVERFLFLDSRVRPRLRLAPDRKLENGERVRFEVRIPGPGSAGRRVRIEARADGRWVTIAGGRTSKAGTWHGGYRFRATTRTHRYAFRALVPSQTGYPYEGGHSEVQHATVVG